MPKNKQQIEAEISSWLEESDRPLLVVVGPTASGKTKLAVELAQAFDGEVINADSRQVYQGLVVGNALTTPEEMQGIPHHLFSCYPLSHQLTVAEYKRKAEELVEDIRSRGKLPIICGGTFLWVDAVVENFSIPAGEPDWELRKRLGEQPVEDLLKELEQVDPESAEQLGAEKNKRYIIRALEIYQLTGKSKSELASKAKPQYQVYKVAPEWDREDLYERINARTQHQLENGMIEEVQQIADDFAGGDPQKLLDLNWPGLTSIGCKEVVPFLLGNVTKEELLEQLQLNNRRYSKRQLTWLRKDQTVNWITPE